MAHYELYFCFPKTAWESAIPTKIKDKLRIVESVDEDTGVITYVSAPTWHQAVFDGKLGAPRYSYNWSTQGVSNGNKYCIIKGEFSIKEGEVSALTALGASKDYPKFSVLTKTEAQALAGSSTFIGSE